MRTIDILGLTYTIEEVDCVNKREPSKGEIDLLNNTILLDKTMPQDLKDQVLLHEILHAIGDGLGYDDLLDDEQKVQGLATALHQLFTTQEVFIHDKEYDIAPGETRRDYE